MSEAQVSSIITQVSDGRNDNHPLQDNNTSINDDLPNLTLTLNVRGTIFVITREELMNLPESILLCLFPSGVVVDVHGNVINNLTSADTIAVDFSPECLKYTLEIFKKLAGEIRTTALPDEESIKPDVDHTKDEDTEDILQTKPALIVLREDLDYYCLPPSSEISRSDMRTLKEECGKRLVNLDVIFSGLKKSTEPDSAEKHLVDMLCNSGFTYDDTWGYRSNEPNKTVINSLVLIPLKKAENDLQSQTVQGEEPQENSMSNAHKLLLFWRKPARKCWWDSIELHDVQGVEGPVKVHIRRAWTLELSVIGVN
ncbi:hypothetical protein NADFUDRAFT_45458 [Nadsonia fulvescens var. elongata DSM 6958]|uniref:Uncharacterized protein n=1 Tax=Nadsonia fulvescens var. elongata DSM 6958 TaxID=857566 RepID=A0A1E3PPU9_9ASCO|nr:hypothetical protein NADFUDRAFT_45458 [Nadsonia fulvescens var. elongata DSM 6958]